MTIEELKGILRKLDYYRLNASKHYIEHYNNLISDIEIAFPGMTVRYIPVNITKVENSVKYDYVKYSHMVTLKRFMYKGVKIVSSGWNNNVTSKDLLSMLLMLDVIQISYSSNKKVDRNDLLIRNRFIQEQIFKHLPGISVRYLQFFYLNGDEYKLVSSHTLSLSNEWEYSREY